MELTYPDEYLAKLNRRSLINNGKEVTRIAYDPSRELYVFDLIERN